MKDTQLSTISRGRLFHDAAPRNEKLFILVVKKVSTWFW